MYQSITLENIKSFPLSLLGISFLWYHIITRQCQHHTWNIFSDISVSMAWKQYAQNCYYSLDWTYNNRLNHRGRRNMTKEEIQWSKMWIFSLITYILRHWMVFMCANAWKWCLSWIHAPHFNQKCKHHLQIYFDLAMSTLQIINSV